MGVELKVPDMEEDAQDMAGAISWSLWSPRE